MKTKGLLGIWKDCDLLLWRGKKNGKLIDVMKVYPSAYRKTGGGISTPTLKAGFGTADWDNINHVSSFRRWTLMTITLLVRTFIYADCDWRVK